MMSPFRAWRSDKGLTLEQAAREVGISKTRAHTLDHGGFCSLRRALVIERKTGIPHRLLVRAYHEEAVAGTGRAA